MAINLKFWNPHSGLIWRVKDLLFDEIVITDRFEGLHFVVRFLHQTSIFFRDFLPYKGFILNGNQSKTFISALWTYVMS